MEPDQQKADYHKYRNVQRNVLPFKELPPISGFNDTTQLFPRRSPRLNPDPQHLLANEVKEVMETEVDDSIVRPNIAAPASFAEMMSREDASEWIAAMEVEIAAWKATDTYE